MNVDVWMNVNVHDQAHWSGVQIGRCVDVWMNVNCGKGKGKGMLLLHMYMCRSSMHMPMYIYRSLPATRTHMTAVH